ncbi:galactosyltransferase [Gregarina niphandrodes]|uniref:Hexosyltransferase n=1 Tax=Gregarina niphandrodes TaxID=110365 RepID=A0A023B152_GRENI|nr:galactosyltransferase [Gregarina niphandrodes]EZG45263.1 galactosyltransferase [Gregarina niphandrodes]|eukprot:XP_011132535.1 galactosyltransferase [Gregarina niphandrodes]
MTLLMMLLRVLLMILFPALAIVLPIDTNQTSFNSAATAISVTAAGAAAGRIEDFPNPVWTAPPCEQLRPRLLMLYTRTDRQAARAAIYRNVTAALERLDLVDKYSLIFPVGLTESCSEVVPDSELRRRLASVDANDCVYSREEERGYNILGADYVDRYDTLYNKSGSVLNFANACAKYFRWLIKVDDDMNIHYSALDLFLDSLDTLIGSVTVKPRYLWMGMEWKNLLVLTEGPNAEHAYTAYNYPPFMSGPFYIMGADTASILYQEMKRNNTVYRNEDAMMGILADNLRNLNPSVNLLSLDHSEFITNHLGKWLHERVCPRYNDLYKPNYDHAVPCHCEKTIAFPNVQEIDNILNRDCELDFNWSAYWSSLFQDTLHYF